MRKLVAFAATAALALTVTACGQNTASPSASGSASGSAAAEKGTIGVAMPTKTSERWIKDGEYLKKTLEEAGYTVNLQYANDEIPTQVTQVSDMVTKKNQLLVIAAIDGVALKGALADAKENGIPVIAYDRLLRETDAVSYYTTFDNFKVGVQQGESLLEGLTASGAKSPWNVELFAGSADDNNSKFFFNGAMSVLQPKIDDGTLKIVSGETDFNKVTTLRWDAGVAKKRMETLLTKSYSDKDINGVLAPYDGISRGIIAALKANGYGSGGKAMPIVTGQDAELESVKMILSGEQYSTIFKDTRELAKTTAAMVQEVLSGKEVTVNDTKTYDNGVKVVPTMLLQPVSLNKANVKQVLLDAGYYTEADFAK
ncbi:MAG: sugar-binding protein [Actinobacteria bacterium]|uniref:multiple monosaccharide ABC transporter substrate-binding protein n=1 Tax=Propionicimonas sp. T2.31MG-18 TaxID=3157620 RepID=UPI0035E58B4E|nr:sugar-binding protein [Actinomycetota bacterium]